MLHQLTSRGHPIGSIANVRPKTGSAGRCSAGINPLPLEQRPVATHAWDASLEHGFCALEGAARGDVARICFQTEPRLRYR